MRNKYGVPGVPKVPRVPRVLKVPRVLRVPRVLKVVVHLAHSKLLITLSTPNFSSL